MSSAVGLGRWKDAGRTEESVPLPESVKTYDGEIFDPAIRPWKFSSPHQLVSMSFDRISSFSTPQMLRSFELTLIWFIENRSAARAVNCHRRFLHFFETALAIDGRVVSHITDIDVLNYRSSLGQHEWYLSSLRGFLLKWSSLQHPGIRKSAASILQQLYLKKNEQGRAVLTHDPANGPLTATEFTMLYEALKRARGSIPVEDFLMSKLALNLGVRPVQISQLKICDVVIMTSESGFKSYFLMVPRCKNRKQARSEFKRRPVIRSLGEELSNLVDDVRARLADRLEDADQAPLFPAIAPVRRHRKMKFHLTAQQVSARIAKCLEGLHVRSPRTGDELNVTVSRLRRTFGSRIAAEGHGELIIAEGLDHSTLGTAHVYVQAGPDIVERIDKAVATAMAPLAQAFLGRCIADESEATRGNDPSSRISDPRFNGIQGSCASYGDCSLRVPVACYTCPQFEPWLDGPHEEVLNYVLALKDTLESRGGKRVSENLDLTIIACAEVVRRCKIHG